MDSKYKLIFFDLRSFVEPACLIFAYVGVPYEDIRLEFPVPADIKSKCPWGSLPLLEVDGEMLAQSNAIIRFLGKKFKLSGDNEWEAAKCDEMVEAWSDLAQDFWNYILEEDMEKRKELEEALINVIFPKFLRKWNRILTENNGFLVGTRFSYADFTIANALQIVNELSGGKTLDKYPAIVAHQILVLNAPGIKEWVEKRPKTDH